MNNERYSRQADIVPQERLNQCRATVIGVGAIGRQVALQLTAIGIPWLQLVDHDSVEISNLASQGYLQKDLGRPTSSIATVTIDTFCLTIRWMQQAICVGRLIMTFSWLSILSGLNGAWISGMLFLFVWIQSRPAN